MKTIDTKTLWTIVITIFLAAALSLLPTVDREAEDRYQALFQRALVTFAMARTLNGLISVVQGTELALQPAGVGLTLTPGEILDPVNDLVERFSWIMLGATVSLGIQNVLLEVGGWWVMKALVVILAAWLSLVLLQTRSTRGRQVQIVSRAFLLVLFVRFAVPLTLLANEALYQWFLESRYTESASVITAAGEELQAITDATAGEDREAGGNAGSAPSAEGLWGSIGRTLERTREALDLERTVERMRDRAAALIEHLIQLSVVFILQTGVLPIAFLWLFLQVVKRMIHPGYIKNQIKTVD
ncbi:MAG: hypothetical protein GTN86_04765 [Xanthomonadales bacterium]|nr:hypothetical protein [Xanthomonadales bacterium]NIN59277.1 hypothetical protein [Xanthomonadales bacterium]NIN74639.1 hypothetical protein [Xanthomonadales bacterium]NIO13305.1 hypothetical protein [Xanthomonadales bacterium]NIP11670.1 hypothetical protein [Xanthomonadales bacterium]